MRNRGLAALAAFMLAMLPAAYAAGAGDMVLAQNVAPQKARVPDGVKAELPVSTVIRRPEPDCPGTELGAGLGNFRQDSIRYTEWANQKPVSNWTNTTETFLGCVDGP